MPDTQACREVSANNKARRSLGQRQVEALESIAASLERMSNPLMDVALSQAADYAGKNKQ